MRILRFLPPATLVFGLFLGAWGLSACASPGPLSVREEGYQEMFDKNLFQERVRLIRSVNRGASEQEVLSALGPPQAREVTPEGHRVFVYRVRCYAGPEPFSRWPRLLSLTSESRIIFDQGGRVITSVFPP